MEDDTMKMSRALVLVVLLAACGDQETTDPRGYTKAPLENPTVMIEGERPGTVAQYGQPNRVVAEEIELPEEPEQTAQPEQPETPTVALPEGVTQQMVAQGKTIYNGAGNCMACHSPTAEGTPLAPALNDAQWLNVDGSYESLVQLITNGVPTPKQHPAPMPARGGGQITDDQVREVAAYIYSISR
jgi:mono/diheme cytochrome c family protein